MIHFTEEMKIGIPHIDAQHKGLVDFTNRVAAICKENPSKEEIKVCLDYLGDYVVRHFGDEESLQIKYKYPSYRQHREIHMEFFEIFKALYDEFQTNGPSEALFSSLTDSVSNWIITHIKKEDVTFGKHYTKIKLEQLKKYVMN